ncbi:hypothetical protein ACTHP3_21070 [Shouchella rhizosphaerae]|uniref:hypothetical protein n=1 Tax=Shouchella rhizosphaerae TaxID=866786 RepID=UPI003F80A729
MKKVGKVILMIFGGLFILIAGLVVTGILMGDSETAAPNNSINSSESDSTTSEDEETSNEPTQKELDDKLRNEAVELDFVAVNNGEYTSSDLIKASGIASVVVSTNAGDEFMLTTEESEDGYGIYEVVIMRTGVDLKEDDEVTVYGTLDTDSDSIPRIIATIVE